MTADSAALLTIEQRVRSTLNTRLDSIVTNYGAYLSATLREDPDAAAGEMLSRPQVHAALLAVLGGAATQTEALIRASYRASGQLGATAAASELGEKTRVEMPTEYIDAVIADVTAAYSTAQVDIHNSIIAAHASAVAGSFTTAALILVTVEALRRAVRRLGVRVVSGAVVAIYRGFADGMLTAATGHAGSTPYLRIFKRWEVTATDPCPCCAALNGVTLPLGDLFDANASTDPNFTPPRVYRDLQGPPRHPNCRCRLVVTLSPASAVLQQQVAKSSPAPTGLLSAAQVRQMDSTRFAALTAFLTGTLRAVKRLLGRISRGG